MPDLLSDVRSLLCGYHEQIDPAESHVTFIGAPRISILRFGPDADDTVTYASLGCSAEPMQDPTEMLVQPDHGPRAELILNVRGGADGVTRTLAMLAASPIVEGLVLHSGMMLSLGVPLWPGCRFQGAILTDADVPDIHIGGLNDPIHILEVIPATESELAYARARGIGALRDGWDDAGIDLVDPLRPSLRI